MDYIEASKAVPKGTAPGLKVKLLSDCNGVRNYVLIFSEDDEVFSGVSEFAIKYQVKCARFSAIGGLKKAVTGWYDVSKGAYKLNQINEQVELVSLIGDIALIDERPIVHAHFSVGFPDGKMEGGHLIEAYTFPTVEMFVTVEPIALYKNKDPRTNLYLVDPNTSR